MRKLITIAAAGLLVVSVAGPALAVEPEDATGLKVTNVNLLVDLGTTVYAPESIWLNQVSPNGGAYQGAQGDETNIIPGQTISKTSTVSWISNESNKAIYVALTTPLTDNLDVNTIPYDDMALAGNDSTYHGITSAASKVMVKLISGVQLDTETHVYGDELESGGFGVRVIVPAAAAGAYTGVLTFTVAGDGL